MLDEAEFASVRELYQAGFKATKDFQQYFGIAVTCSRSTFGGWEIAEFRSGGCEAGGGHREIRRVVVCAGTYRFEEPAIHASSPILTIAF